MALKLNLLSVLHAAAVVAAARLVPSGQHDDAKGELPEGSIHEVDATIRVRGRVTVGTGSPASSYMARPRVNLLNADFLLAVLGKEGIGTARLRRLAREVADDAETPEALTARDTARDPLRLARKTWGTSWPWATRSARCPCRGRSRPSPGTRTTSKCWRARRPPAGSRPRPDAVPFPLLFAPLTPTRP